MPSKLKNFLSATLDDQIKSLYLDGAFIVAIRYYGYKVNLYLVYDQYIEVFYNHKYDQIEKIQPLDFGHSRMKFYADQISLASIAS